MDSTSETPERKVRIWADGCFDMVHFGHANALRQAKLMGDVLVVGVHSDSEIEKNKGPPVFSEAERYKLVRSIKWVDEVVENAPYTTELDVLDTHDCDFCVHGDDISLTADLEDAYHKVKGAMRYKECKRTQGVSTTDLVGRMLLATKSHFNQDPSGQASMLQNDSMTVVPSQAALSPYTKSFPFLQTTQTILDFSDRKKSNPGDRIVYVAGDFDLFHVGHVDFLEAAAKEGDYVIVGLHGDQLVNSYKSMNYPIMNLNERTLSVLPNRNVANVVIGAPYHITKELMDYLKIDIVCADVSQPCQKSGESDPYEYPKAEGKFKQIDTGNVLTAEVIVQRIIDNRAKFEARNAKKEAKEIQHLDTPEGS